ncbi:MAG: hypothetical protein ABI573_01840 [Chloroflexota bacterium]
MGTGVVPGWAVAAGSVGSPVGAGSPDEAGSVVALPNGPGGSGGWDANDPVDGDVGDPAS